MNEGKTVRKISIVVIGSIIFLGSGLHSSLARSHHIRIKDENYISKEEFEEQYRQ